MKSYLLLSLIFGILLSYTTLGSIPVANAADMSVDIECVERTLVIKILGKDGQPLENAKVRTIRSLSTQNGIVNEFLTDSTGIAEIVTGKNTGYVWITKGGYNDQKTKVPYCNVASTINDLSDFSIDMNCSDNVLILKVFTKSKTPIPNAIVITYDSFNQYSNEFRTDEKGILELRPVFNTGKISITKIGYNIQTLNTINCVVSENQYVSQTTPSENIPSEKIPSPTIPSWIKNNAKWWADGTITESDFLKGVEHLIQNKIIKVSTVSQSSSQEPVPEWVKNNAKWWADGMIDDKAFYQGIEFLANNGILNIKIEEKVITKSQLKQFFPSKTSKDEVYNIEELGEELELPGYMLGRVNDQYITTISLSIFNEKNYSKSNLEFEIKDFIIGNPITLKNAKGLCYQTFQVLENYDGFSCLVDNVRIDVITVHMENLSTINYAKSNLNQILQKIGDYNNKKIELIFNQSSQVTTDNSETVNAKTFLVYENNLNDNYKLKPFTKIGISSLSEQNMFQYKGKYDYVALVDKGLQLLDIEKHRITILEPSDDDKIVFTLPLDYGVCYKSEISSTLAKTISCYVDGWILITMSTEQDTSFEQHYELMDVMLQKYYYNKDSEFTQSTKELVKSGTFVAKKEKTYDEIINSLVEVNVISCSVSTNYVNWKGSVTSLANQPIDVFLILSGVDRNGKIVTFVEEIIFDLYPGQTEYLSRLIDDVSGFNKCAYKLERVELSN